MYGRGKHINIQLDLKSANKETGAKTKQQVNRENKLVMEDVEQISNPISNGHRILVDYKLNNEKTMRKKAAACTRDGL